jgi:hypothetical protein
MRPGTIAFACAAASAVLSGLFLAWTFSSSSLAFVDCNGTYSFFAELPRCRVPAWVSALFVVFALLGLLLVAVGVVQRRRSHQAHAAR